MDDDMRMRLQEARNSFEQLMYAVNSIAELWYVDGADDAINLGNDSYPFDESMNEITNKIELWCMDSIYNIESILLADKVLEYLDVNTHHSGTDVDAIEMIHKCYKHGLFINKVWWKDINYLSK